MPVIVVGADTPLGRPIVEALAGRVGQVRAFVSDDVVASELRQRGVHVALGDVSDGSHVEGAATNAHTAVLVTTATIDDRERSFAPDDRTVLAAWATALGEADVTRAIWVLDEAHVGWTAPVVTPEHAVVRWDTPDLAVEVARLDDAATL